MSQRHLTADIKQVIRLGDDYAKAAEVGMRQVAERGEQITRAEVPEVTRNLKQGVSSDVTKRGGLLQGEIIVTARSGRLGQRKGTLHLGSGFKWHKGELVYESVPITLSAVPAFNYAEAVATGTGIYGPKGVAIKPKKSKVLLIPVTSVPTLNGKVAPYIESDGKLYVMRRSMKGRKPDRYDERAARRLGEEAPGIFDNALNQFVGGQP
jgi:hypothetical protein